ncbi:MAG: RagB/SusD family nutrient uptake outer membrane protein [Alistipes shahii]|uniref:RagB/SusD family nutrient uptake outer membrane protein n=1 Tax=Alistipes shahii TaxID=328814 RepID=UPI00399CFA12
MGRYYAIDPASDYKSYPQMYDLEYEAKEAASLASAAWGAGYKIIAQANDLIAHTEKTDDGFFTNEEIDRNTILGEAYAIRAMMHFDLMRLFGASMEVDADGRYIPYASRPILRRSMTRRSRTGNSWKRRSATW